jgi:hypothetical protein
MGMQKRHTVSISILNKASIPRRRPPGDARPDGLDWPVWLGLIDRKRRLLQRSVDVSPTAVPEDYFVVATCGSFRLEGIDITEQEVIDVLTHGAAQRRFRSRAAQRIRNHVAILHTIEIALRIGRPLKTAAVVRWYTSISSGLSLAPLSNESMTRLDQIARRINSPQLRLQPAIQEIVRTHLELLVDPLFPGFNGILSRLLLRYHLGRCGLPFVTFNEQFAPAAPSTEAHITLKLMQAMDETYQLLLG